MYAQTIDFWEDNDNDVYEHIKNLFICTLYSIKWNKVAYLGSISKLIKYGLDILWKRGDNLMKKYGILAWSLLKCEFHTHTEFVLIYL